MGTSALVGFIAVLAAGKAELAEYDPGLSLIKNIALFICIITILIVGYKTLIRRNTLTHPTTKWVLLIAFLILSPLAYFLNLGVAVQESKPVSFCNSCHPMEAYVEDLTNPDSELLAALHYQYRWISDHQCYTCHSDYGIFGDAQAKIAGIRHFWSYYIAGYETPIKIRGTYNNERCLHCHAPVRDYQEVPEHEDNKEAIEASKMSCIGAECHVSPHPKPEERKGARNGF